MKNQLKNIHTLKTGVIDTEYGEEIVDKELLKELAETYNPKIHEAPVQLGHTEGDWNPAHGWITKAYVKGNDLYLDAKVSDDLADWLKKEYYKKRSISYYTAKDPMSPVKGKAYIRHLAFLGATPPVVKGLKDIVINFSEKDMELDPKDVLESSAVETLKEALADGERGFKQTIVRIEPEPSEENNWLVNPDKTISGVFVDEFDKKYEFIFEPEDDGFSRSYKIITSNLDETVPEMGEEESEDIKEENLNLEITEQDIIDAQNSLTEGTDSSEEAEEEPEEMAEASPIGSDDYSELKAELETLRELAEKRKQELDYLKEKETQARYSELKEYSENLFQKGKIVRTIASPSDILSLLVTADSLVQPIQLSEDSSFEGSSVKPVDLLKKILDNMEPIVSFGEHEGCGDKKEKTYSEYNAPKGLGVDDDALEVHKEIIQYCEKNGLDKVKDYAKAMREVYAR